MSNAIPPIGLDLKLLPQPGHGNSKHHHTLHTIAPSVPSSSSSLSSSKRTSTKAPKQSNHGESNKIQSASSAWNTPSVINNDKCSDTAAAREKSRVQQHTRSPFSKDWVCSHDFVHNRTPSRKDGISYSEEMTQRRIGTTFIRQVAIQLKLKPICKETAYIYFHRFFMLRSLKTYEPHRIALACLYLACKFEDHPIFKEHLIRLSFLSRQKRDVKTNEKDYNESSERLILDENLLLQVLGFHLKIEHYQMNIVTVSQRPIEGTSKALYTVAYKISSEINRLTMLCVEYPAPILTCATIYLAAIYQGFVLPEGWCAYINGATAADVNLVTKIGEEYKELLANNSDLVKTVLKESGVKCHKTTITYSPNEACRGSTPQHSSFYGKDQLGQQFLTNFSPDSAYSSNSSHSPPENGNSSFHSRTTQQQQSYHNSNHLNVSANYSQAQPYKKQSHQHFVPSTYSPTEMSFSSDGMPRVASQPNFNRNRSVVKTSFHLSAANQATAQSSAHLPLASDFKTQKRKEPSTSSNLNAANLSHVAMNLVDMKELANNNKNCVVANQASHRKRMKTDHHLTGKHQPSSSSLMHGPTSSIGTVANASRIIYNADVNFTQLNSHASNNYQMSHY